MFNSGNSQHKEGDGVPINVHNDIAPRLTSLRPISHLRNIAMGLTALAAGIGTLICAFRLMTGPTPAGSGETTISDPSNVTSTDSGLPGVQKNESDGPTRARPAGMAWIPGGEFEMGSDDEMSRMNEQPTHRVKVDGFWIDETSVTNAEFLKFTDSTGYITTAERTPDWDELKKQLPPGTPKPDESLLVPGSIVFVPSEGPVDLRDMANFWRWTPGANWRHPEGPESDLKGRENHPVVQVSWDDAVAYAKWAGKRLPTEAEWEFASRGGLDRNRYAWGNEFQLNGKFMANTWDGSFPYKNTQADGFIGTSPVKSFPCNGYGLYDMGGNVWNWCSDWYRPDTYASRVTGTDCINPQGPEESLSPINPYQIERVTKGGSFLCHPDYCASYRPSARRGMTPDSGMSHVGFRCVALRDQDPR